MRALTHRRAKTPWTDDEKSLINEFTAITDLPNKNDVKDKAQVLQGKYKMTFTDDQTERWYQKINYSLKRYFARPKNQPPIIPTYGVSLHSFPKKN